MNPNMKRLIAEVVEIGLFVEVVHGGRNRKCRVSFRLLG